jgi:hypothetical protein
MNLKVEKETLEEPLPSLFFSHSLLSTYRAAQLTNNLEISKFDRTPTRRPTGESLRWWLVSVPMEGKGEKSKGKRSTKNSKELRGEESDMEKALRKSQKEERRAAKRKAKEDKELEDVLELSRLDTEKDREKCASMMLELRSSATSIPPKLEVLGITDGRLELKGTFSPRTCPFTGAMECDPNVEERILILTVLFASHRIHIPQVLLQNLKILAMIRYLKQTMALMNLLIQT